MELLKVHILGKRDDLKNMQKVESDMKRICLEVGLKSEIILTHNFSVIPGQSFNVSKTPIVFFNEQVEFTGMPDVKLLKNKVTQIRNMG